MKKTPPVLLINDKAEYNLRYRRSLMEKISQRGQAIESIGLFDQLSALPILLLRLLFGSYGFVLSSNLKSNLAVLVFANRRQVVILNGLGRYRNRKTFRLLMNALILLRKGARIIVQNYADYRYLKRHCPSAKLYWIPGSGGTRKQVGPAASAVIVQRNKKIEMVAPDISAFLEKLEPRPTLTIVGCTDKEKLDLLFAGTPFRSAGFVDPERIFQEGRIFLQPTGYGEGFPHTLADAIVSGMDIHISSKEYLRYGLGRLGGERQSITEGWCRLQINKELQNAVHVESISQAVLNVCDQVLAQRNLTVDSK